MRIAAELESLLLAARELATRRGDASTTEEHFLLVFAETPEGQVWLSANAIRVDAFVRALEGRLGASQPVPGYRGAAPRADLDPMLHAAFDARGFMKQLLQPLAVEDVVVRELTGPFAAVAESARFDVAEVDAFYNRAVAEAGRRLHTDVFYDHALFAELGRPSVKERLRSAGVDASAARRVFDIRLHISGARMAVLDDHSRLVMKACVHANTSRLPLSAEPLVVEGLRSPVVSRSLELGGVDPFDLIYALAHGRPPMDSTAVRGVVQLALYDDRYTTFEFVLGALMSVFELTEADSLAVATKVHESGRATFGSFAAEDASTRLAAVRETSRLEGMPLRIELIPRTA